MKMKPATMVPNSTDAEELNLLLEESAANAPNSLVFYHLNCLKRLFPTKSIKKKSMTTCLNHNVKITKPISSTSRGLKGRNIDSNNDSNTDSYCSLCNCSYKDYTGKKIGSVSSSA